MRSSRLVMTFSAACLAAAIGHAANTGSLEGSVLDNQGDALPGVTVQISSEALIGGPQVAIADADGSFAFYLLPVGTYTAEARLVGFEAAVGEVRVRSNHVGSVTFRMVPEHFSATVEVSAEVPVVDTSQVNASQVWDEDYLRHGLVGSADRWYLSVVGQSAGVVQANNPRVYGSTGGENAYLIDGMNTTDPVSGTYGRGFNIDAIQEMSLQAGGFEAEFGQATGGIVNLVSRSGGNQLAGSG